VLGTAEISEPELATLRSALFVPGDVPERHQRAFDAGADAVILDLEDAVAPTAKDAARQALTESAAERGVGSLALVRVNSPHTALGREDLAALPRMGADGIVVPKADPEALDIAAELGLPLVALIETAGGVLGAAGIAAHPAVATVMLGPVDLGVELGVSEAPDGDELIAARSQIVIAAAAAGKRGPLDGPCLVPRDELALAQETARARRLGFSGKACIHPAQVAAVNRAFSPTREELAWARAVLDAFDGEAEGAAVLLDGEMIDEPVARRARQILARKGGD
jgi:citrate lyase subunit beta/citryl-CoA lyase